MGMQRHIDALEKSNPRKSNFLVFFWFFFIKNKKTFCAWLQHSINRQKFSLWFAFGVNGVEDVINFFKQFQIDHLESYFFEKLIYLLSRFKSVKGRCQTNLKILIRPTYGTFGHFGLANIFCMLKKLFLSDLLLQEQLKLFKIFSKKFTSLRLAEIIVLPVLIAINTPLASLRLAKIVVLQLLCSFESPQALRLAPKGTPSGGS